MPSQNRHLPACLGSDSGRGHSQAPCACPEWSSLHGGIMQYHKHEVGRMHKNASSGVQLDRICERATRDTSLIQRTMTATFPIRAYDPNTERRSITTSRPPLWSSLPSSQCPQTRRQILDLPHTPGCIKLPAHVLIVKDPACCLEVREASTSSRVSGVSVRVHLHPLPLDRSAHTLAS